MLRFYAKSDTLVRIPGAQPRPGQPDMYVGRKFDLEKRAYPAVDEAFEVDEDSDAGKRLMRLVRVDKCLYPADKKTADLCGVEFINVEFESGSFVEKVKQPKQNTKQPSIES